MARLRLRKIKIIICFLRTGLIEEAVQVFERKYVAMNIMNGVLRRLNYTFER